MLNNLCCDPIDAEAQNISEAASAKTVVLYIKDWYRNNLFSHNLSLKKLYLQLPQLCAMQKRWQREVESQRQEDRWLHHSRSPTIAVRQTLRKKCSAMKSDWSESSLINV